MKLSLLPSLLLLASLTMACGNDPGAAPAAVTPTPSGTATTTTPPSGTPPVRTLTTTSMLRTNPANLVVDPEFQSLWKPLDESGYGLYEAYVDAGKAGVAFTASTPVGPSKAVLSVVPTSTGGPATLTMVVQGGGGPFAVRVWVGTTKGTAPTVELLALNDNLALPLVAETERTVLGDTTWVEYRATNATPLMGTLYLSATVPAGTEASFVAPEVLSGAIATTKSHGPARALVRPADNARKAAQTLESIRRAHVVMAPPPRMSFRTR